MRSFLTIFLTLFLIANVHAKGRKMAPISIAFFTESSDLQSRKFSIEIDTPKGKRYISKTPFIATSDITAYHSFTSPHNPAMLGATFKLDRDSSQRLKMASNQYRGKWIICMINGQVADMLRIDRPVDGRIITVWRGIDPAVERECNKLVPHIGEDKKAWKARLKKEKKSKRS